MTNLTGRMPTRGIQNPIPTKIEDPNANMALKMIVDGSITYIATATPGTPQASPLWRCQKIDESVGLLITWADGNTNFDNQAVNLAGLSYS